MNTLRVRLERLSEPEPMSGCWIFMGSVGRGGYGQVSVSTAGGMRHLFAHRASYLAFKGPVAPGLEVCHRCDCRRCINPAHLFTATRRENHLDCLAKGRWRSAGAPGPRNGNARLTWCDVHDIRRLYYEGGTTAELAARFNVSTGNIWRIVNHLNWQFRAAT